MEVCPNRIFKLSENFNRMGYHYVEPDEKAEKECSGCRRCVILCPDVAIEIYKEEDNKEDKKVSLISSPGGRRET